MSDTVLCRSLGTCTSGFGTGSVLTRVTSRGPFADACVFQEAQQITTYIYLQMKINTSKEFLVCFLATLHSKEESRPC